MPDTENPNTSEAITFPESPEVAMFLAASFIRLGGTLQTSSTGNRCMGQPCYSDERSPRPQLPDAKPHEQFHTDAEWTGALKLLSASLSRLAPTDKNLVFGAFGAVAIGNRKPFDFRDMLS